MTISMLVMFAVMFAGVVGVGAVGFFLGRGQRSLPPAPFADHRLDDQGERIEMLEDELQRLRDQAEFTEKLLTERAENHPSDSAESDGHD